MEDSGPEIRLSDRERDAVITRLRDASSEGRITLDEFGERTRQVYSAQFPSEIDHLTRDLPVPVNAEIVDSAPVPAPAPSRERRWLVQVMGGGTRSGNFDPGKSTVVVTLMGGQVIDLTRVDVDHVSITAFTLMGGTEVIVPDGAVVDIGGFMLMGGIEDKSAAKGDSNMKVSLRAIGGMGGCTVRTLSKKERAKRLKKR